MGKFIPSTTMSKRRKLLFCTVTAWRISNFTKGCTAGNYICENRFAVRFVRGVVKLKGAEKNAQDSEVDRGLEWGGALCTS